MKLDEAILKRMINELKDNLFAVNSLRKTFLKQCDDLKRILDDIGPEFVKQRVDLKRILDESGFGRATVCDEDNQTIHEAEWIQNDFDKKFNTDDRTVCSKCGGEYTDYIWGHEWDTTGELPNFCPHCGRRMKNATEKDAKLLEKAMTLQTQAIVEGYVKEDKK